MQWYQDKDAEWAKQQCRSLPYINFHTRNRCQPIAHDYGLAGFKALFAMRARTQLRVDETFSAAIRIYSNDGFALSIHEVGTFTGDGDTFYEDYKVLGKLAHPQQTTCKAFTLAAVTFESGKIYAVDVKYYQTSGDKCLKVALSILAAELGRCGLLGGLGPEVILHAGVDQAHGLVRLERAQGRSPTAVELAMPRAGSAAPAAAATSTTIAAAGAGCVSRVARALLAHVAAVAQLVGAALPLPVTSCICFGSDSSVRVSARIATRHAEPAAKSQRSQRCNVCRAA